MVKDNSDCKRVNHLLPLYAGLVVIFFGIAIQFNKCYILNYKEAAKCFDDRQRACVCVLQDMKPFACHLCSHRCSVRGNLDKHLRTVHSLDIPDKRRLSHLYNLGRCGRPRIPASDEGTVTPHPPGTAHADSTGSTHRDAQSTHRDAQAVEGMSMAARPGQADRSAEAPFTVPYTWTTFQNCYQNIQY